MELETLVEKKSQDHRDAVEIICKSYESRIILLSGENEQLRAENQKLSEETLRLRNEVSLLESIITSRSDLLKENLMDSYYMFPRSPDGCVALLDHVIKDLIMPGIKIIATSKVDTFQTIYDWNKLLSYNHTKWINSLTEHFVLSTSGDGILRETFSADNDGSLAIFFLHRLLTTSSPSRELWDSEHQRLILNSLFLSVNSLLAINNPDYVNPFILSVQLKAKFKTNSPAMVNTLNHILPGGCSYSFIDKKMRDSVKKVDLKMEWCMDKCNVSIGGDNNSVCYNRKTVEIGMVICAIIWTTLVKWSVYLPKNSPHTTIPQTNYKFAKSNWKPLSSGDPEMLFLASKKIPKDEGVMSPWDILENNDKAKLSKWLDIVVSEQQQMMASEPLPPIEHQQQHFKVCLKCNTSWDMTQTRKRKCDCGAQDPLVDLNKTKTHATKITPRADRLEELNTTEIISRKKNKSGKIKQQSFEGHTVEDYNLHVSNREEMIAKTKDFHGFLPQYISMTDNGHVVIMNTLPSVMANPGSIEAVKELFEMLECFLNLYNAKQPPNKPPPPPGCPLRWYFEFIGDGGVPFLRDHPTVIQWLGQWHLFKNFLEGVFKILATLDLNPILAIWDYTSPNSVIAMTQVFSVKKSFQFLRDGLMAAMFRALVINFMEYQEAHQQPITAEELVKYVESSDRDDTFENYVFLLLDIISSIELMKSAMRKSDMDSFEAARLSLLPINFALNNCIYGKRNVEELYQLYHQVLPEFRQLRRETYSFDGKGQDERVEEVNERQKALMGSQAYSEERILEAGVYLEPSQQLNRNVDKIIGLLAEDDEDSFSPEERTHINLEDKVHKTAAFIANKKLFYKNDHRDYVVNFAGKPLERRQECPKQVYDYGLEQMREYIPKLLRNENPTFPPGVLSQL